MLLSYFISTMIIVIKRVICIIILVCLLTGFMRIWVLCLYSFLSIRQLHAFLYQVTHDGWMTYQKNWYGLCYVGDTLVTVVSSCKNLYEIAKQITK